MDLTHIKEQAKACLGNYYGISVLAAFLPMAIISAVQTFPFVGTVAAVFLLPLFIGGARIFLSNYRKRDTSMG